MNTRGEYVFQVRSYECGPDGLATMPTICNFLQETASLHAEALGFSKRNFAAEGSNISWVLTKLRVRMTRYPQWEESVVVATYPRGGRRITAHRDFELRVGDELVGLATSEWMVIDLSTRKIVPVPPSVYELANDEYPPVMGEEAFSRLRWDCRETAGALRFLACRGDIDLNGHVNNVRYVAWLCEALPFGTSAITDLELVFKSETLAGDEVLSEAVEVEPGVWAARIASPDARNHVVASVRADGRPSLG